MESLLLPPTERTTDSEVSFGAATSHVSGGAASGITTTSTTTNSSFTATTLRRSGKSLFPILGKKQQRNSIPPQKPDPLGGALTELLNQHAAWKNTTSQSPGRRPRRTRRTRRHARHATDLGVPLSFQYPVLSRHNLYVLQAKLSTIAFSNEWPQSWKTLPTKVWNKSSWMPILRAILLGFQCMVLLTLIRVILSYVVVVFVARNSVVIGTSMLLLLIDWNEVVALIKRKRGKDRDEQEEDDEDHVPWLTKIVLAAQWMDSHWLGGKRYNMREWNRLENAMDPLSAESRVKSLWELPPPSIKQGRRLCLNRSYMMNLEHEFWSRNTVDHRVAIHFCYVMIREDYLQRQAASRQQQRQHQPQQVLGRSATSILDDSPVPDRSRQRSYSLGALDHNDLASSYSDDEMEDPDGFDPNSQMLSGGTVAVVMNGSGSTTSNYRKRDPRGPKSPRVAIELLEMDPTSPHGHRGNRRDDGLVHDDGRTAHYDEWLLQNQSGSPDCLSEQSSVASDCGDMPWIDVTAQIGMRLLNSAHVHRAIADPSLKSKIEERTRRSNQHHNKKHDHETVVSTRRSGTKKALTLVNVTKPVHPIWTSPSAAAATVTSPTVSENGDTFDTAHFHHWSVHDASIDARVEHTLHTPSSPISAVPQRRPASSRRPDQDVVSSSNSIEVQLPQCDHETALSRASPDIVTQSVSNASIEREPLQPGIKVAVPILPIQPRWKAPTGSLNHPWPSKRPLHTKAHSCYQMGTVVRSKRIYVGADTVADSSKGSQLPVRPPNCLSVTVKLDKSFLRNAEFAELTYRVLDEWVSSRYVPRHSKVPIGSCVATKFGLGVVVGWRVQDSIHVVRSLWQRRGNGSAHAYLQASAIYSTVEAAVGFDVDTKYGRGVTLAYVNGGRTFESGRFFVAIKEDGRFHGHVLELHRKDIYSCLGAQFIPVIEHIREAALYKIQLDNYEAALREQNYDESQETDDERLWKAWSACLDILWNSFLRAVEEDSAFDEGVNDFMTSIIEFLERLDENEADNDSVHSLPDELAASDFEVECYMTGVDPSKSSQVKEAPGLWVINDILGGVFKPHQKETDDEPEAKSSQPDVQRDKRAKYYTRVFAFLRTIMKTVSFAKAESVDHPHFRMALAISHDFLLFVRTIVRVQQKNSSNHSLEVWKQAFDEIALTFGPLKDRLEKIGRGIALRMEKQGRKAKTKVLRFVDTVLGDEKLLFAMEQGEWDQCLLRLEHALVKSKIVQEKSLFYYRKTGQFIYDHVQASISNGGGGGAAARNNEKLALFGQALRSIASPLRSVLKVFLHPDVLDLFERILVRVYCREEQASRILSIHASNFNSLRHLRMLKDFSVAGKIWIPLLDAADEEFSCVVAHLPENSKEFMCPLSSLFSLCVAQFHKINAGDLSKDWLDFLLEDDAAQIIQDIDMKLILALESFSRDIREMMEVLPYYPSIDDDILKLMDEVNLDDFLKEASAAIDDPESLSQFLREKATIAIERFLNYLPRMSIPVERRELGDGWILTCRGQDGSDLTLSDVKVKRENLVCQILGGDTLFFPMFVDDELDESASWSGSSPSPVGVSPGNNEEESILDHIRGLLLNAQSHGCWREGIGGVGEPPTDRYVAAVLQGLPVSSVLNCAIELWRNLEIDDDELLEIAIRDVSYQIQLQKVREEGSDGEKFRVPALPSSVIEAPSLGHSPMQQGPKNSPFDSFRRRFNPRVDPTVLFLEMKNLTLHLDNFMFRIEKNKKRTVFDPVFEGRGMVSLHNINIRLRVHCAKERIKRGRHGSEVSTPILHVQELAVELENMQLRVKDTGFGSDWLLNRAVHVFEENITKVVEENLRDQILEQSRTTVENLNSYFAVNPNILLNLLGVSLDDLEENVVFV